MKYFLKVLTTPSLWTHIAPFDKELDEFLLKNMDKPFQSTEHSIYTKYIKGLPIYIGKPYPFVYRGVRPALTTILKLEEKYKKQFRKEIP